MYYWTPPVGGWHITLLAYIKRGIWRRVCLVQMRLASYQHHREVVASTPRSRPEIAKLNEDRLAASSSANDNGAMVSQKSRVTEATYTMVHTIPAIPTSLCNTTSASELSIADIRWDYTCSRSMHMAEVEFLLNITAVHVTDSRLASRSMMPF